MYLVRNVYVCCLVLWVRWVGVVGMNMTGEVGLVLVPAGGLRGQGAGRPAPVLRLRLGPRDEPVPRAEEPCIYKYPKKKHFNALLSDMMNELTKIYMRARDMVHEASRRRGANARFRVVSSKHSAYFDGVYANMTIQYKKFYEKALEKGSQRSGRDPCQQQAELRRAWQDVLEGSRAGLRAAALRAVRLQLDHEGRTNDSKLKNRLGQFLLKEFGRYRSHQLDVLCHEHALCYKDLLQTNATQKFNQ